MVWYMVFPSRTIALALTVVALVFLFFLVVFYLNLLFLLHQLVDGESDELRVAVDEVLERVLRQELAGILLEVEDDLRSSAWGTRET